MPASTGLYSTVFCLMLKLWFPRAVSKGLNPLCQALPTCIQSVYSLYLWPIGFPEHRTGFTGTVGSQEWGETCATCGGVCSPCFLIQNLTDHVPEMRWRKVSFVDPVKTITWRRCCICIIAGPEQSHVWLAVACKGLEWCKSIGLCADLGHLNVFRWHLNVI